MLQQLDLFANIVEFTEPVRQNRSGSFVDNMSLPVHRWFRYSAGFAAPWVEEVLTKWSIQPEQTVLDPFAGSGTVSVVCDTLGIRSIGLEAHPTVGRIARAKTFWKSDPDLFRNFASQVVHNASRHSEATVNKYPDLILRSYDEETLITLDRLKSAWLSLQDASPEAELTWLALSAILRPTSKAGTAQWQYILPNKTKKKVLLPLAAFRQQIDIMLSDMYWMQAGGSVSSRAELSISDARTLVRDITRPVDAVITSPPYANNYDYADALRFEMTFWGDIASWSDIHDAVRQYLIVSSSQHSSREKLQTDELLSSPHVVSIRQELGAVVEQLAEVREHHGGKKHYHTMIAAYCRDISIVLQQLRSVCKEDAHMCWVIGDSAPYGVYCPIDGWIGQLALAAGFKKFSFEKLRDRNIKWKNRKHRVPLKEGLLWIEG